MVVVAVDIFASHYSITGGLFFFKEEPLKKCELPWLEISLLFPSWEYFTDVFYFSTGVVEYQKKKPFH